jgi:hypothetical protein
MRTVAIVLAVLAVAVLAWGAGELHYQGCIAHAEQATGTATVIPPERLGPTSTTTGPSRARLRAVNGCSRLPF